jgi:hypothetical protein
MLLRWRRRHEGLKSFAAELERGRVLRRYDRGLRTVPVEQIVGSVSKAASMDRRFRYKSGAVDRRLKRVRDANRFALGVLPPVDLYAINDEYYVVDGHHRVAVALENDQIEIDAYVTAYEVEYPAPAVDEPAQAEPVVSGWRWPALMKRET